MAYLGSPPEPPNDQTPRGQKASHCQDDPTPRGEARETATKGCGNRLEQRQAPQEEHGPIRAKCGNRHAASIDTKRHSPKGNL